MKITINVDTTPQEARSFLGLPDLEPMQQRLLQKLEDKVMHSVDNVDPMELLNTWLPGGMEGLDKIQSMFWNQMSSALSGKPKKDDAS